MSNNENRNTGNSIPNQLKDSEIKNTRITSLKKKVEDTLMALKDLATLELLMPVTARMTERLKTLKKLGSANSIKIRGHWKTTPPNMHIQALRGIKINNDEAEIKFSVFETDSKGDKKLYQNYSEIVKENGDKVKRVTSAEYKIIYEVTETIKMNKPITREIMKIDIQ